MLVFLSFVTTLYSKENVNKKQFKIAFKMNFMTQTLNIDSFILFMHNIVHLFFDSFIVIYNSAKTMNQLLFSTNKIKINNF